MKPRGVLLAALALVLAAAAAPAAQAAAQDEHQVMFVEKRARFEGDGNLVEGQTQGFRFVVAQDNVTRIDFSLEWRETGDSSGLSGPDAFSLAVRDPSDKAVSAPVHGSAGRLHVAATALNDIPEERAVPAHKLGDHLAQNTGTEGKGVWRATVRLEDAGNPDGTAFDEGNAFTLTVWITYYEGVPMRVVSLPAAAAAGGDDDRLLLAIIGLSLLSAGLGALLAAQAIARRRRAKRAAGVSPAGDNPPSPAGEQKPPHADG